MLAELLGKQRKALAEAARHARSLQSHLDSFGPPPPLREGDRGAGEAAVLELRDMGQAMGLLERGTAVARHQIRVIQPTVVARHLIDDWLGGRDAACPAGVGVRSIHRSSVLQNARAVDNLGRLARRGVRVRVAPLLPFRLVAVDETFVLARPPGRLLLIREPALVQLLFRVFEFCWDGAQELPAARLAEEARPAPGAPAAARPALTEEQLLILRLWAKGRQDAAIARELHVSPRTLRRMVSALLRRLGVSSRFEAGLAVAELLRPHGIPGPAERIP